MDRNKKFILVGLLLVFSLAAWQGWTFFEHRRESASVGAGIGDPFIGLVIPEKYAADPATKAVIEGKIAATKAMYAEKPDIWETWIAIGNLRAILEDFDGAIDAYKQSVALQENNILGYRNIAEMYIQHIRDYEKAADYYRLAIENQDNAPELYVALAFVYYKHLGNNEEAEKTYIRGLQRTQFDPEVMTSMIQFYKDTGNIEKYVENVRALIAQHSDNVLYRETYTRDFAAMGLKL